MEIEEKGNSEKKEHTNGWHEWSRFVLKELERLNENYEIIARKLEKLPCESNTEKMKSLDVQVAWVQKIVWTICVIGIPAFISLAVAWGGVITTVTRNTGKVETFYDSNIRMEKDIADLKTRVGLFHSLTEQKKEFVSNEKI